MHKIYCLIILVSALLFVTNGATAQSRKSIRKTTRMHANFTQKKPFGQREYDFLTVGVNALNYYGDLAPMPHRISTDISFTRPGLSVGYGKRKGPRFGWQSQLLWGQLFGSDESISRRDENGTYRAWRNLSFRNNIKKLSIGFSFDLLEHNGYFYNRPAFVPYVTIGGALFHHNPKGLAPLLDLQGNPLTEGGRWVSLRPLGTEGQWSPLEPGDSNHGIKPYSRIQGTIWGGPGVRLKVKSNMDLAFEMNLHLTGTDYLDDVSKNYVDLGILPNELARSMSYRSSEQGADFPAHTYQGRNGIPYSVRPGYGSEHPDNMRGNRKDNDMFMVTTIKLFWILEANHFKPKSR